MDTQLPTIWDTHNGHLLRLIAALPADALADALAPRQRTVGAHLAHLHNVRLMWLKAAAPDLLADLTKLEKDPASPDELTSALTASAAAIRALVERGIETGRVKQFGGPAAGFLAYLVAHEWYHVGKADLLLRHAGHAPDDKLHYSLWEGWNRG